MKLEHIAGEPDREDMTQPCTRCGELLVDLRGAMVEEGSGAPAFWSQGPIYQDGNCFMTSTLTPESFSKCAKEGTA